VNMLALRVQVNTESPIVAGAPDLGVLNAIVGGVGRLGPQSHPRRPDEPPELHLTIGGLTARGPGSEDEHLRWVSHRELKVGDRIVVDVLEATTADPVESEEPAARREHDEREYFEHCRRVYFELRGKYEPEV
jgi:hypothetical protein